MITILDKLTQLNLQVVQIFGQGNLEKAVIIAEKAIKLAQKLPESEHPAIADSFNNLAELYRMQGRYSSAQPLYLKALTIRKHLLGDEHPDIAQALNNLAALYFSQGYYSDAEQNFFEALNIWKRILGDDHPDIATNLNNIAEVYREQGRYLSAEQVHVEVLAMRKRLWGDEHAEVAQTLNNLAALYETQGRYLDAEKMHLEALEMKKSLLGEEHLDITVSLNNLAVLYDSQGRYAEAETKHLEVLARWKKFLPNEHPYVASTLNNIAANYKKQGRYLSAEKKYIEALAMRKLLFGEEHPDVATSLNNLAEIYLLQGRYLSAEQKYLEAYSLRKRLFTSEHSDIAHSLNNLAVTYAYQGRYLDAEQKYLEALPMWERLLGKEHPELANYLTNLAANYQKQGRYSEAEQKYLSALEIRRHILGKQHPDIATSLNQIAEIYRMQGRYSEAERMLIEALAMRKRLLGEQHPDVAASLNNLAVLYDALFRYSQAESLFLEALTIVKSLFGNEHPEVASSMNNLAAIYGSQGRYLEAEQMHLEVLRIRKSLLGEEHPSIAVSLNNLAELYFSVGRYQEAEQKYVEALAMRKRLLGSHPDVAVSLNNLATVLAATQRPTDALSYRIQASKINDKMIGRVFAFSSESDRLAFLQKIRSDFDLFLSLVHKHLFESETAKQQALDLVLTRKALTASALAAQNEALYSGRYPQLTEKFRQLNALNAQLVHLTFSTPQSEFTTYRENLAQLQAQHNNLQKQLASQVPEIQLSEQTFDRCAVASALPPNSILVEFVRFDVFNFHAVPANAQAQWYPSRYLAFILPSGQPDAVQMVDLGEAEAIDELIRVFRLQASDYAKQTLAWGQATRVPSLQIKAYNPTAAIQLSQALFNPIRDLVRNCQHLLIAPDGNLNLVPFQVLPVDDTGTRLLIDEYTISYLGVGREILRTKVQPVRRVCAPLVMADPDSDLGAELAKDFVTDGETLKKTNRTVSDASRQPTPELLSTLGGRGLSRAPGTRFLGESVAKKLKDARLYLGAEALETQLISSQCPSIMLIATHGLFLPDSPQEPPTQELLIQNPKSQIRNLKSISPMMRSGLALAGANTWLSGGTLPKEAGKGFVFAQDIAGLDLWANELTVLSACDTARGDIKIGEGVFGLRRAFAVAGSKTLVMSLWKVPDRATALLMERFFDNLKSGMGRAEALQKAQHSIRRITVKELRQSALGIEVLKELLRGHELSQQSRIDCQEEDTPLLHPFYWGAWICQGDGERGRWGESLTQPMSELPRCPVKWATA